VKLHAGLRVVPEVGPRTSLTAGIIVGMANLSGKSTEYPYIYPDQSLSLALEKMGTSGVDSLPVVSRANFRQLLGVLTLRDILNAYGLIETGT